MPTNYTDNAVVKTGIPSDSEHYGEVQPRQQQDELDFELPAKACDLGRPEGCESCQ